MFRSGEKVHERLHQERAIRDRSKDLIQDFYQIESMKNCTFQPNAVAGNRPRSSRSPDKLLTLI